MPKCALAAQKRSGRLIAAPSIAVLRLFRGAARLKVYYYSQVCISGLAVQQYAGICVFFQERTGSRCTTVVFALCFGFMGQGMDSSCCSTGWVGGMGSLCCEVAVLLQQTNANRRLHSEGARKESTEDFATPVEVVLILFLMTKIKKNVIRYWKCR